MIAFFRSIQSNWFLLVLYSASSHPSISLRPSHTSSFTYTIPHKRRVSFSDESTKQYQPMRRNKISFSDHESLPFATERATSIDNVIIEEGEDDAANVILAQQISRTAMPMTMTMNKTMLEFHFPRIVLLR